MKKISVVFLIFFLILLTAFIKNSTKRIEDEIFLTKENIRGLKKNFENMKLEYDYLSSAERLLKFQEMYFDEELIQKKIININTLNKNINGIKIEKFKITNE
tara:strand:+ start:174 stop:479 length:306 start_codon:yes stop_codon:yes gene_type:complete